MASPVITSAPILGTLAEVAADGKVDLAGVVDSTQIHEVLGQWRLNGNVSWKAPSLKFLLERATFSGKRSTPYAPGSVHDYMHAKVTVADDTVFIGSFNLSHSRRDERGERPRDRGCGAGRADGRVRRRDPREVSGANAGLAHTSLDEKALYERDVNLRIGFRFLNDLLKQYRHDYELALLAYNRGPGRVNQIVADGGDPSNGYENAVLRGYQPKRVTPAMQARAHELGS